MEFTIATPAQYSTQNIIWSNQKIEKIKIRGICTSKEEVKLSSFSVAMILAIEKPDNSLLLLNISRVEIACIFVTTNFILE